MVRLLTILTALLWAFIIFAIAVLHWPKVVWFTRWYGALCVALLLSLTRSEGQTLYTNSFDIPTNIFTLCRDSCPTDGYSSVFICSDFNNRNDSTEVGYVNCPWTNFFVPFSLLQPGTNWLMIEDVNANGVSVPTMVPCTAPGIYAWFLVRAHLGDTVGYLVGPHIFQDDKAPSRFWEGKIVRTDWNPKPYYTVEVVTDVAPAIVKMNLMPHAQ